jgi:hypothetical protein
MLLDALQRSDSQSLPPLAYSIESKTDGRGLISHGLLAVLDSLILCGA